jgi:predicted protein tyrosine phosphatase
VSDPVKLLFICSQNRWRSLTAEKMYEGFPGYEVRSAGIEQNARVRVTEGHVGWADKIFVMEKRHVDRLRDRFGDALNEKQIVCLHVDDDYRFMDEDLVAVLREQLRPHVDVPE